MIGRNIPLRDSWVVGDPIGRGSFGRVHEASGPEPAAIKFVPKAPGAERELLVCDLPGATNVVPIIDFGEADDYWVLVMPRAEKSLRELLQSSGGPLTGGDVIPVLTDIASGLAVLSGRVVHRDLKPENVLFLDGRWCLADFGISRYAEASTAPDTHKYSMTSAYAAPEQWRSEHASNAADVYAFGVIAYEAVTGSRPFAGPDREDYRHQHLHELPRPLEGVPPALASLIDECLLKAPAARPTPANIVARLERLGSGSALGGLGALQEANRLEVLRQAAVSKSESVAITRAQERQELFDAAVQLHTRVAAELLATISAEASSARATRTSGSEWILNLGAATLEWASVSRTSDEPWGDWQAPAFSVIAHSAVTLSVPPDRSGYEGRSHSLWYCDAHEAGKFEWFETAFMITPLVPMRARQDPFALAPGKEAAQALWVGMAEFQLACPFTQARPGDMSELIERWAGWLAKASSRDLSHPSQMPERETGGSWRRE